MLEIPIKQCQCIIKQIIVIIIQKHLESLWQCRKDIPTVDNNGNVVEFNEDNATESFNFKAIITG